LLAKEWGNLLSTIFVFVKKKIACILIVLPFILGWAEVLPAQSPELYLVNIKGKVISADNSEPIPYAHVINQRVHGGTTTNIDGNFSITMLTEDTLIIRAVGYVDQKFSVSEYPPKPLYEIKMNPVRYLIDEVTVTDELRMRRQLGLPEAKPLDIPTEYRGDAYNEKPSVLAAIFSPLSYLQYSTSEREKSKRATLQAITNGKEWEQFSIHHNLENIKRLTGLQGEEAERFMIYCNINNRLPFTASEMEIEFQIMDLYFKYLKEKETGTKEE